MHFQRADTPGEVRVPFRSFFLIRIYGRLYEHLSAFIYIRNDISIALIERYPDEGLRHGLCLLPDTYTSTGR